MEKTAVLVGFGSIGKTHAQLLSETVSRLIIVDSKETARRKAKESFLSATVLQNIEETDSLHLSWGKIFAVIATWGPSHAPLFHFFADRGVKHILCEKPLTTSLFDGHRMILRAQKEKIALGAHHWFRHIGFGKGLKRIAEEHQLGKPEMVLVQGGAKCLVNNGVHNIDMATELFETEPKRVISTAKGDPISPRSPEFHCYGGTAVWSFGNDREAIITFHNHSSLSEFICIYYRNAIVTSKNYFETITIKHREKKTLAQYPAVTRSGPPKELLFKGVFSEMCSKNEGTKKLYAEILEDRVETSTPQMAFNAVNACVGAIISGETGASVSLPIDPDSTWGKREWPMT